MNEDSGSSSSSDESTSDSDQNSTVSTMGRDSDMDTIISGDKKEDFTCIHCYRQFKTKQGLKRHVKAMHVRDDSRTPGRIKCPLCGRDYANQSNLARHMKNQHEQRTRPYPNVKLVSPKQVSKQKFSNSNSDADFGDAVSSISRALKSLNDDGVNKSLICVLTNADPKGPKKRKSNETHNYSAKRANTIQTLLCPLCETSIKSKSSLIKHLDKCRKRYDSKHVQKKHKTSDGVIGKPTNLKTYDCFLCKDVQVDVDIIKVHYHLKHKVVNPEEIAFHNTNIVPLDTDTGKGNAVEVKKQLKKSNHCYNDNTCRLCENHTNDLKNHYISYHQVDAGSLNNVPRMFRNTKPKPAVEKVNASDENKRQDDEEDGNDEDDDVDDDDDDDDSLTFECICGIDTKTYDATVDHAQICQFPTNTNKKMSRTSAHRGKVIKYNPKNLLKDGWSDMFTGEEVDKDSILSSSIYKRFRYIRLHSEDPDCSTGHLEYRCGICKLCVDPKKVENHCFNYDTCIRLKSQEFPCEECKITFNSKQGLAQHRENYAAGIRIVTFNNKDDLQINKMLEKIKCTNDDLQHEIVETIDLTEKQPQFNNIDTHAASDQNIIREGSEPQAQMNSIDEHAGSPMYDANNEKNDDAGTDKPLISATGLTSCQILTIKAEINTNGSKNVTINNENTGFLQKNLHDHSKVNDNQDCFEQESVTRIEVEPQLPLEQFDSGRPSCEDGNHPMAAMPAGINSNANIGAQLTDEGKTNYSEDNISRMPPQKTVRSPLETPGQSNHPTSIPDVMSSNLEEPCSPKSSVTSKSDDREDSGSSDPTESLQIIGKNVVHNQNHSHGSNSTSSGDFRADTEVQGIFEEEVTRRSLREPLVTSKSNDGQISHNSDAAEVPQDSSKNIAQDYNYETHTPNSTSIQGSGAGTAAQETVKPVPFTVYDEQIIRSPPVLPVRSQSDDDQESHNRDAAEVFQSSSENMSLDSEFLEKLSREIDETIRIVLNTEVKVTVLHETKCSEDEVTRMPPPVTVHNPVETPGQSNHPTSIPGVMSSNLEEPCSPKSSVTSKSDDREDSGSSDPTESLQIIGKNVVHNQNHSHGSNSTSSGDFGADTEVQGIFEEEVTRRSLREPLVTSKSNDGQKSHNSDAAEVPQDSSKNIAQDYNYETHTPNPTSIQGSGAGTAAQETVKPVPFTVYDEQTIRSPPVLPVRSQSDDDQESHNRDAAEVSQSSSENMSLDSESLEKLSREIDEKIRIVLNTEIHVTVPHGTKCSEDELTRMPPPVTVHNPVETSDQSNQPTSIPDATSSEGEESYLAESRATSQTDNHAESDSYRTEDLQSSTEIVNPDQTAAPNDSRDDEVADLFKVIKTNSESGGNGDNEAVCKVESVENTNGDQEGFVYTLKTDETTSKSDDNEVNGDLTPFLESLNVDSESSLTNTSFTNCTRMIMSCVKSTLCDNGALPNLE